jgi:hypothetical protein
MITRIAASEAISFCVFPEFTLVIPPLYRSFSPPASKYLKKDDNMAVIRL